MSSPDAPTIAFPLTKLAKGDTRTLRQINGLTFKVSCQADPEEPTETQIVMTLASDEAGTMYSSTSVFFGNMQTIGPADGDVQVLCYSSCTAGTGYFGGIEAGIAKPSGIVFNGSVSIGIGVLGADAVICGSLV